MGGFDDVALRTVLVTNPASGYRTLKDLENANRVIRYGTTGVGTGAQLASALLFKTASVESQAVPFDGGAPALTALWSARWVSACSQAYSGASAAS